MSAQLLIIDPQNDFCDLPPALCPPGEAPALPVAGALADLQRLARFIDAAAERLDAITVTLDSHLRLDIAHPGFWCRADGSAVAPFTPISAADLRSGAFRPRDPQAAARAQAYVDELQARGRYTLMVWPVHAEVGSWGQAVQADVRAAYNRWEERRQRHVERVLKGRNPWTEHYSALMAEVPDAADPGTQLDRALLARLAPARPLLVAGQASSHCVRATTEHLVEHLVDAAGGDPGRIWLLADCMSPVAGFETEAAAFLDAMRARGLRVTTSTEALRALGLPRSEGVAA
ncbi:MAG: cysteine hydrolase [Rubrivivax sp.]